MKVKSTLHAMLLAGMLSGSFVPAFAADDTTSSSVYDFSGFSDTKLMQLFYNAYQNGRKYPTAEEFAAAGIQQSDIAFIRSHVRNKGILDRADRLIKDTYEKRDLWMNIPWTQVRTEPLVSPTRLSIATYSLCGTTPTSSVLGTMECSQLLLHGLTLLTRTVRLCILASSSSTLLAVVLRAQQAG